MENEIIRYRPPKIKPRPDDYWIKREMEVDAVLEQFLNHIGQKVKVRRATASRRAVYKTKRMRCGAPSVNYRSFTEDDLNRFERENDGFPIAANDAEVCDFDEEVFCGDARMECVGDHVVEVKVSKSRSNGNEAASSAKRLRVPLVSSPSKPKFLERLITGVGLTKRSCLGGASKRHENCLLTYQDSSTEREDLYESDTEEDIDNEDENSNNYLQLLHEPESCVSAILHEIVIPILSSEPSSPSDPTDKNACSLPTSPVISGLVKQRCESFKRLYQDHDTSVLRAKLESQPTQSERKNPACSPRSRRRCFSPLSEKTNRWVKSFYSLSRDKNFSRAVMEKGYVRALAEQINSGNGTAQSDNDEEQHDESFISVNSCACKCKSNSLVKEMQKCVNCDSLTLCQTRSKTLNKEEIPTAAGKKGNQLCVSKPPVNAEKSGTDPENRNAVSVCHCAENEMKCSKEEDTLAAIFTSLSVPEEESHSSHIHNKESSYSQTVPRSKTKENRKEPARSQSVRDCGSILPKSPKISKSLHSKPAVDYARKPKIAPVKSSPVFSNANKSIPNSSSSSVSSNGHIHHDSEHFSKDKSTSCSFNYGTSVKKPLTSDSSVSSDGCGERTSYPYDNVVFISSDLSPQELFDMSWTDSDSDFTDYSEEDTIKCTQIQQMQDFPSVIIAPGDKLHQIADELLRTERTYVRLLSLLQEGFYFRIDKENRQHGFLPGDTLTQMFSSIQSIHQFHKDFLLKELEERMLTWESDRRIGDLMKKFAPFLKLYTAYIKNFDHAMNLIKTWMEKSPKFAAIIQEVQKLPECGSLSLQHHMLGPIQRVPRYELLLKDYIKHLPHDSVDKNDAQDALDLVTKAASHSNEAMNKIEKFHKLLDIYQKLRGVAVDFISPTRDFVREGPITKISARSGEKQSRYLFLFNDLLLVCSEPLVGAYRVRAQLDVDGMEVKKGDNLAISGTFLVHSKQKAIEFLDDGSASGENQGWQELLREVIQDYRNRKRSLRNDPEVDHSCDLASELGDSILGKQAPRWIPDDAVTMCMVCQQTFTAFRRRHHCRACGWLMCKGCSKKAPLEYMNNKMERVCINCHNIIIYAGRRPVQSPTIDTSPKKKSVLQVKANDPGLLSGYLHVSEDCGKTWNRRWFTLREDFVMYFFRARQDVSAYSSLPLPGYSVEVLAESPTDRPHQFKVHHKNKKVLLFHADNEKLLKKWTSLLGKLVLAQLPDESQRLSSQSNSSTASSSSDTPTTPAASNSTSSDTVNQADNDCPVENSCPDSSILAVGGGTNLDKS